MIFFKSKREQEYRKLIFELYYQKAYNAAYYYCGDPMLSEEAAQEAIYKAMKNIKQLRDPDKIEAWIKRIAVNNINNLLKKQGKVVKLENAEMLVDSLDNTPEHIIITQEKIDIVKEIVEDLDPISKQIVHLRFYEELKVKHIAEIIDKPEGTVKTLIYKAKNIVEKKLKAKGYYEPKRGEKAE